MNHYHGASVDGVGWDGIFPGWEVRIIQANPTDTYDISEYFPSFMKHFGSPDALFPARSVIILNTAIHINRARH